MSEPVAETWAVPSDVLLYTQKTVSQDDCTRAQAVVDLAVGRTFGAAAALPVGKKVRYWLKLAVAYQAAWMQEQADLFSRSAVTDFNQDGAAATYAPDGQTLAPLAQMAIKRLPWKRSRTITVAPSSGRPRQLPFNMESSDTQGTWRPL